MAMEEEERRPVPAAGLPRPLIGLSVNELEAYILALEGEVARVRREITQREGVRGAAEALFKKRQD